MSYTAITEWMDKKARTNFERLLRARPGGGGATTAKSEGTAQLMRAMGLQGRPAAPRRQEVEE